MLTLEERFWSMVWRCQHRWPCKRCCWPWAGKGIAIYNDPIACYRRQSRHALFRDARLPRTMSAHLVAYILGKAGGVFTFPGRLVEACHSCDYGHCCNYAHVSLGAPADNMRDKRGKLYGAQKTQWVSFPDGRRISFASPFFLLEDSIYAHVALLPNGRAER